MFKGVQACRLPGPKPFKPSRKPFEGNSRSYTPRPSVLRAFKPAVCRAPNPSKPSAGLSKATLAIAWDQWKRECRDVAFNYIYKHWFDSYMLKAAHYLPVLSTCRMQRQKGKWWWWVSKSKWCPSWAVLCLHSWARADQHGWVGWLCRSLSAGPLLRRRVGGTRALAHSICIPEFSALDFLKCGLVIGVSESISFRLKIPQSGGSFPCSEHPKIILVVIYPLISAFGYVWLVYWGVHTS